MDWGLIGTILAVIFFGLSVFLYIRQTRKKKPAWAYVTTRIIGLGTDAPPELKLTFNDRAISDAYRTTLIFCNRGNEAIRKNDVTENVRIHFEGAEVLREPTIVVVSKDAIKFKAKQVRGNIKDSIQLNFLYLGHSDGGVVEVLHTKTDNIVCSTNIIDAKATIFLGKFNPFQPERFIARLLVRLITLIVFPGMLLWVISHPEPNMSQVEYYVMCGIVGIMTIGFLAFLVRSDLMPFFRFLKFPRWSTKIQ